VRVRGARIARLLGVSVPTSTIAEIFSRLGLKPKRSRADFTCTPPSYRFDLVIEEDFIEEVARLYGYENIPAAPAIQPQSFLPDREELRSADELRERLVDRGYQEVITFSFVSSAWETALGADPPPAKVLNPIASHLDVMRTTLFGGLLDTLRTNVNRKQERVRIFEVGRCFTRGPDGYEQPRRIGGLAYGPAHPEQWGEAKRPVDFFDVKGDVEALAWPLAVTTEAARHPALHPGRSALVRVAGQPAGWVGELHPRLLREFELPSPPVVFELDLDYLLTLALPAVRPVSKLPVVRRDLAVVVDKDIPVQSILDALVAAKVPPVDQVGLFDLYRGPGVGPDKKSLAILVLMQDTERTLTDAEIDAGIAHLLRVIEDRFSGTLRK